MSGKMLSVALAVAAVVGVSSANAALTAYEGFDGTTQSGFGTNFPAADGGDRGTQVAGLAYGTLQTTGFAREGGQAWANRGILPAYVDSGTQWISFLYRTGTLASDWTSLKTGINADIIGDNERYNFGAWGDRLAIRGTKGLAPVVNSDYGSAPQQAGSTTYMLVVKYDFGAADTADGAISMWINPDVSSLGTGSTPTGGTFLSASGMSDDSMRFNIVGFWGQPQSGRSASSFDELRFGDSWASVSPTVPEPGMLALLAGSSLLALRRRSR